MTPLIDGDVLLWEVGSCEKLKDQLTGEESICGFDFVRELMDRRIDTICYGSRSTEPPKIYLTGKGNFREAIAVQRIYKDNRKDKVKPYHYDNLKGYLIAKYGAVVVDGMEADDAMCIEQTKALSEGRQTIICSRDKDLRQCQGLHYSWECGEQPEWGPYLVEGIGELFPKYYAEGHKQAGQMKKLTGTGHKWFLAQILMGDSVDHIPGLKGWGPKKVYDLLKNITDYEEGRALVAETYKSHYAKSLRPEQWLEAINEQAKLVWMVRELDDEGNLIMAEEFV